MRVSGARLPCWRNTWLHLQRNPTAEEYHRSFASFLPFHSGMEREGQGHTHTEANTPHSSFIASLSLSHCSCLTLWVSMWRGEKCHISPMTAAADESTFPPPFVQPAAAAAAAAAEVEPTPWNSLCAHMRLALWGFRRWNESSRSAGCVAMQKRGSHLLCRVVHLRHYTSSLPRRLESLKG